MAAPASHPGARRRGHQRTLGDGADGLGRQLAQGPPACSAVGRPSAGRGFWTSYLNDTAKFKSYPPGWRTTQGLGAGGAARWVGIELLAVQRHGHHPGSAE
jgi:hypothetical protein